MQSLILANLTEHDWKRFHEAQLSYTGSTADPSMVSNQKPWGELAPYIATYVDELTYAVKAMCWKHFTVEIRNEQWIVRQTKHQHRHRFHISSLAADSLTAAAERQHKTPHELLDELVAQKLGIGMKHDEHRG